MNENNEPNNTEELNSVENEVNPIESIETEIKPVETEIEPVNSEFELNNTMKKGKGPIYFIIALFFVIAAFFLAYMFLTNKEKTDNNKEEEIEEIIYIPDPTKNFSFGCKYKSDFEANKPLENITSVKNGDRIICFPEYEVNGGNPLNDLTFETSYGSGLKLVSTTSDKGKLEVNPKTATIHFDKAQSVGEVIVKYEFEVIDSSKEDNLFVSLDSVKFKSVDGKYYESKKRVVSFLINRNKYYMTRHVTSSYINVDEAETFSESSDYIKKTYECTNDCKYAYSSTLNHVLFIDGGLVAYNFNDEKKERIDYIYNSNFTYRLVADTKVKGLIIYKTNTIEYYSIEDKKTVIILNKDESHKYSGIYYDNKDYLRVSLVSEEKYEDRLVNLEGEIYMPILTDLKALENSNYYYFEVQQEIDLAYVFYTKEGKPLFEGRIFSSEFLLDNGNLIITSEDGNKFLVYDSNYELTKTSKEYNKVYSVIKGPYFIIVDSDNYLKLIDIDEIVKSKFTEMTKNLTFHPMISGWYTENNKNGIYLVLGDTNIEYPKLGSGLEYFYIPETGETGVIKIEGVGGYAKPVLYLYPKEETKVNVSFSKPQLLTTTYPKFIKNWEVTASPNGDLYDNNNKYYYGLYWEEEGSTDVDFKTGFYVTKDTAIKFLEDKLSIIGLNDRERNEFIMYWLPIIEKNGKNLIYFELTEERDSFNKLIISPKPDSLLRVAIHVKKIDSKTYIKEQTLPTFNRVGFTAIEWGGVIHN